MLCTRNDHLGIRITYRKQRRHFALKGLLTRNVIANLDIHTFIATNCHKVDFLLIKHPDIDFPTAS